MTLARPQRAPARRYSYLAALAALLALALPQAGAATAHAAAAAGGTRTPTVEVVRVIARRRSTTERLPAELAPWQAVAIYSKVRGFVERIDVDRGSVVRAGEVLIRLSAPELLAQTAQAEAATVAAEATYRRLLAASDTPGAVSANELELAEQAAKADAERTRSLKTLAGYLVIRAPFSGIITERNVHPGSLAGPPSEPLSSAVPLLRLEQVDRLRLIVPVPQDDVGQMPVGASVSFSVRTWPGRLFRATVSRVSHALDPATRTMPVEADVYQKHYLLDPGMFVEVLWPVQSPTPVLLVPKAAIGDDAGSFVQRVNRGIVEKVPVEPGKAMGQMVEVTGDLEPQDLIVAQPSAQLAEGTRVQPRLRPAPAPTAQP